ncbi:MAG: diaminopimelate decarboxylase [Anaerocolumna sp.]|jgi:diaminopimelate decarboxylase|nr:diaminopimelate decarboxylase [Anaerocolumna sp.]
MKTFPLTFTELQSVTQKYPTPFYIYNDKAIRNNIRELQKAFSWNKGFKEYFAVKATPNPHILSIFKEEDCGVECSSEAELIMADKCGFHGDDIMFTSNSTPWLEFVMARNLNALITLDDINHIDYLRAHTNLPKLLSCRFNPERKIVYNSQTILDYEDYKFGFTKKDIIGGFKHLLNLGVERMGIHSQFGCHRTETDYFKENIRTLFLDIADIYKNTNIPPAFINLAGGIGISYHEENSASDIYTISTEIKKAYEEILIPLGLSTIPIYLELGIYMTGPYGYFVASVLHIKENSKTYACLDASTNAFMTPCKYSNYHHINIAGKEGLPSTRTYDITGALCENRDKFAIARSLPELVPGDLVIFHDAGAYGYSHSNQFNGRLRPKELLVCEDGSIKQIRRNETVEDYFRTLMFPQF